MWDKIVNIMKKVLQIGAQTVPTIVAMYSKPLGALLASILQSAVNVEAAITGTGNGPTKKEYALMSVQAAMPAIQYAFGAAGKPIKNEELFAAGVDKLQDGIVDILNSTGELTK